MEICSIDMQAKIELFDIELHKVAGYSDDIKFSTNVNGYGFSGVAQDSWFAIEDVSEFITSIDSLLQGTTKEIVLNAFSEFQRSHCSDAI